MFRKYTHSDAVKGIKMVGQYSKNPIVLRLIGVNVTYYII